MTARTPRTDQRAAPARRGRRALRWIGAGLGILLALCVALAGALLWAVQSPAGTARLWALVTRLGPAQISGTLVGGALRDGVSWRDLRVRAGGVTVRVDHLEGRWTINRAPWRIHIAGLHAGNVEVTLSPTPRRSSDGMPDTLALPLALNIERLTVARMTLRAGTSTTVLTSLAGSLHTDGTHHSLRLDGVETPVGALTGSLRMTGARPYPLTGAATLAAQFEAHGARQDATVSARFSGSLQALRIEATGAGAALSARAQIDATPFRALPLARAQISAARIDPRAFWPGAPEARLSVHADLRPDETAKTPTLAGWVQIDNALAGSLDQQRVPLQSLRAQVRLAEDAQQFIGLDARLLGGAQLAGRATLRAGRGVLRIETRQLDLHALHGSLQKTRLAGPLTLDIAPRQQQATLDLTGGDLRVQVQAVRDAAQLTVQRAQIALGSSRLTLAGALRHDAARSFALQGSLAAFDPSRLARVAKGRIHAEFDARGALAGPVEAAIRFAVRDSVYAGLPMTGAGNLHLRGSRLLSSDARLEMAGNRASLRGSLGAAGDRLRVMIDAPQLARLQLGVRGALTLTGDLSGTLLRPQIDAALQARQLAYGGNHLGALSARARLRDGFEGLLQLDLSARHVRGAGMMLRQARATLDGTRRAHRFRIEAEGGAHRQAFSLALAGDGALTPGQDGDAWAGTLAALSIRSTSSLRLNAPARLSVAPGRFALGRTDLMLDQTSIRIDRLESDRGRLRSAGRIDGLDVARALELARGWTGQTLPVHTDLILDGQWDFDLGRTVTGVARMARRSGDFSIRAGRGATALGLTEAVVMARGEGARLAVRADLQATRIGRLHLEAKAGLAPDTASGMLARLAPDAPLSGAMTLDLPSLAPISALMGADVALDGALSAHLTLAGTPSRPKLSGLLDGQRLDVALYDSGIRLTRGTVRMALQQNVVDLREVVFHGGEGTVRAEGRVQLDAANPNLAGVIVADRLQLLADPDRALVLSGQARIAHANDRMSVAGTFRIDLGRFNLPKDGAPNLGDDVVIARRDEAASDQAERGVRREERPAGRFSPTVEVDIDFGDRFRFKGAGADLLLGGQMRVVSAPLAPLRGTGSIQVREGVYEAFGRKLTIEQGVLNFTGPINNPSLNILAMRRNQEVEAGVQVTGTVRQPRVKLVSEPSVPDEDKLSWLMFGYGASNAGLAQQQAMSGAALGLLGNVAGKSVARRLGLDELSIGPSSSGLTAVQVVSLGRAISERIAIGYEQSLSTADSIVKLTWQFSQRWSVVARGGTINGASVLFNQRF